MAFQPDQKASCLRAWRFSFADCSLGVCIYAVAHARQLASENPSPRTSEPSGNTVPRERSAVAFQPDQKASCLRARRFSFADCSLGVCIYAVVCIRQLASENPLPWAGGTHRAKGRIGCGFSARPKSVMPSGIAFFFFRLLTRRMYIFFADTLHI